MPSEPGEMSRSGTNGVGVEGQCFRHVARGATSLPRAGANSRSVDYPADASIAPRTRRLPPDSRRLRHPRRRPRPILAAHDSISARHSLSRWSFAPCRAISRRLAAFPPPRVRAKAILLWSGGEMRRLTRGNTRDGDPSVPLCLRAFDVALRAPASGSAAFDTLWRPRYPCV